MARPLLFEQQRGGLHRKSTARAQKNIVHEGQYYKGNETTKRILSLP